MTGYKSKRDMSQDKLAQPAQEPNWAWATKEDFYRELDRRVERMRKEMEIKTVTMRCKDYDVALPIIDTAFGHVLVGQVSTPPQRPWVDHEPDGRMATQKFIEAENKKVSERYGYVPKLHPSEWQDKLAQPAQDSNWAWVCNECGAQEFTSALSEADLDYLACSTCGGDEFHKEALAQPAQEPVDMEVMAASQRKPLTQDGTMEIANQTAGQYWMDEAHIQRFRAAVEAAHGIGE